MRIALLTSNTAYRNRFKRELELLGDEFQLVYTGNDPRSYFTKVCEARPDILMIRTGEPGFNTTEVFRRLPKMLGALIHNELPDTKVLLQVDRDLNKPLIEEAKKLGISYIDSSFDTLSLREAFRRIYHGTTVEMLKETRFETYGGEPRRI